jgi:S1-C subfamily serine protease
MSSQAFAQPLAAFSEGLADVVERAGAGVVALQARRSYPSSGVVVRPGVVVTAAHTLRRDDGIAVVLPDGTATSATLVGVDGSTDIAVLRLASGGGATIEFGDAAAVRPGHFVVAVARGADGTLAASAGVVARTGGEWRTWRGGHIDRRIQLDGGLWAGFSGGPVVDARGNVLGIGTSALSRGRAVVIPGSVLSRVTEQLLASGRVSQPYIGAAVQPVEVPQALRDRLKLTNAYGLIVVSTVPGGPADAAGITLGDTLLSLAGKPLADIDDLKGALGTERIGNRVNVSLLRGGQLAAVEITVAERPSEHRR